MKKFPEVTLLCGNKQQVIKLFLRMKEKDAMNVKYERPMLTVYTPF